MTQALRIKLDEPDHNGWPTVYEVGARHPLIAERENIEVIDLHFFTDGACCLGLQLYANDPVTFEEFMGDLVIPFFYRLSYTDAHGLSAARQHLWGEYSHGDQGLQEYLSDLDKVGKHNLGRNELCACGSGLKYKRCHLGVKGGAKTCQWGGAKACLSHKSA
ncbi:MAG: SEC-C domain-containing protein [Chloroflexota bacterium]|nr:SEC-C domain-containing protein [Chloroflexota bacterium]